MWATCPICGKRFDVVYTHLWRYRRIGRYLCSYRCLRQYDKGDKTRIMAKQTKITLEIKKKCVRIALDGGNPLDYLRKFGVSNPAGMWNRIKNNVKETDPETWEKLPKRVSTKTMETEAE